MMSQAYFVSKNDIISWINQILKVNMTKIEQLGTGAILCQLIDAHYSGIVPMQRVSWKARTDHEFIGNLKLLQKALLDLNFKKVVDVS